MSADRQDRYNCLSHSKVFVSAMVEDLLARVTVGIGHKHASRPKEFPVHQQRPLDDVRRGRRDAFLCFLEDKHEGQRSCSLVIPLSDHS